MNRKHDKWKGKPVHVDHVVLECIILVPIDLVFLIIQPKQAFDLYDEKIDGRRENIQVEATDFYINPGECISVTRVLKVFCIELQKVKLLVKNDSSIAEDL